MKNTLGDLNDYLFQTLQNLTDPEEDEEGNKINEVTPEQAKAVVGISNQIVSIASLQLEAIKQVNTGNLTQFGNDTIKQNLLGKN